MHSLRNVAESDLDAILALNAAEVQHTSPMDLAQLQSLLQMAAYSRVVTVDAQIAAFVLALREGAPYENDNYRWFAHRFARFLYVDRVVVGARFAGRKVGSGIYADLFAFARAQAIGIVTCEYNIEPPNPASQAFHDRFRFKELGTQWVAGGSKRVSLQAASVGEP
ncbi:MAG: GNAT family N-acetyltransferase [Pseudomarimonas sp.]